MFRVTPSATPVQSQGSRDSSSMPHVLLRFLRPSLTDAPSRYRSYPASSVVRASAPPQTARPVSRELPVDPLTITAASSRVPPDPLCLDARRRYPCIFAGSFSLSTALSSSTFPKTLGQLLHYQFPQHAQRSLALEPADSPIRLIRPSPPQAPAALLPPAALRLQPGGAIQFQAGSSSFCGLSPFHSAQ